jgi:hypothetical protein
MRYLWDRPHLVDDSAFRARFGMTATSLEDGARHIIDALAMSQQLKRTA